ncbi:hypothetical protein [Lentilactobacillus sp. Marseille-Q4993]|uniref:hypothetical protein n=1 Tax=Lentilactobacillus sp. Marseille-Q4993 TaxID=3039492 RepID=UPI0024BC75F6|nr:hypothetical protein [Lentilactobacillus sp. Marseille-Q4993]
MYTINQVMSIVYHNESAAVLMAFMTYAFGFAQYITSMVMQVKGKEAPFYFWMHAWYFGHDLTFSLLFHQWFTTIHFWLFEVLWAGCVAFVGIEIFSLYYSVKYERNTIWKKYLKHDVSTGEGWRYGIVGYALGFSLFFLIRLGLGDQMCLILMMSTNAILALAVSFKLQEMGSRRYGTIMLGWFTLSGTIFTFLPKGLGFFATLIPPLDGSWFTVLGIICTLFAVRYLVIAFRMPKTTGQTTVGI